MAVRVIVTVFFAEHGCLWIREKVVAWFFVCCGTKLWLSFFSAECLSATGLGCGFGCFNFFVPQDLFISHRISCHMLVLTRITRDVHNNIVETSIVVGSYGCCCVVVVIGLVIWILWGG